MARYLLINYDNGSHIPFFPQGLAYLARQLEIEGHDVEIFDMAITHDPMDHLDWYLNADNDYDVVGLGFCAGYYQYRVCKQIAKVVNASRYRKSFKFILGAQGPAGAPEFFLKEFGADMIIRGEGESVIGKVRDMQDPIVHPEPGNPDAYAWPAYHLFNMGVYKRISWPTSTGTDFCMPILSGRGCPFSCSFCFRMDEGFRPRSAEAVIEEMLFLHGQYGINHFQFSDELFMSGDGRITKFLNTLEDSKILDKIPGFKWDCNGRLNFAKPDIMKYMAEMKCQYVNYGIEALDDDVLKQMKKALTVDQIYSGIEATLDAGLFPGLNFMWGNPGDSIKTLQAAVNFLLKFDPCHELRTIRPVTPYPGCPLYYKAIDDGKLIDARDFYERAHTNSDRLSVNFTDLPDWRFHAELFKANMELYKNYTTTRYKQVMESAAGMYFRNEPFRGFRPV
jgi:radical SAM superfamily enzyme YgiQ (UPF0313 family)